jgi:hypothetical protein
MVCDRCASTRDQKTYTRRASRLAWLNVDVGYFLLRAYEKARLDVGVVFDVDSDAGS